MPLYRLAQQLARAGVPVSAKSLGDLFHRSAELLAPLYRRLLELVAQEPVVNGDETRIQVQQKEKTRRAWMWVFLARSVIVYVFSASRSGKTPKKVLGATGGTLVVDAYTGYNQVCTPEACTPRSSRSWICSPSAAALAAEERGPPSFADGVWHAVAGSDVPKFQRIGSPTQREVQELTLAVRRRVLRRLARLGVLRADPEDASCDLFREREPVLAGWLTASLLDRVAVGERAGELVMRLRDEVVEVRANGIRCAVADGINVHAATTVATHDRDRSVGTRRCSHAVPVPIVARHSR